MVNGTLELKTSATDRFNQMAGKHGLVNWLAIPCR
jgi:hypothetical protein